MSDTEEVSSSVTGEGPVSPAEQSMASKGSASPSPNKDETSRDGSSRTEHEDMEESTSIITGNSSPVSHAATEPNSDMPDEDFEMDTSTASSDRAVVEGNVRGRRPKSAGYYKQLDEGTMDVTAEERSQSPASSTTSSARKRRPRASNTLVAPGTLGKAADIQPEWLVPFEHGWKRQVIIRATANPKQTPTSTNKAADTYYLPPHGKKLRSMPEIEKYLVDNNCTELTSANFTFRKEAIYKEPLEEVRQASKGVSFGKKSAKKEEPKEKSSNVPEVMSVTNSVLTVHKSNDREDGSHKTTVVRAVAKKHTGKRTLLDGESVSKKPRLENGNSENGKQKLCSLDCPNRGGGPPSLHCEVCMCLYHPECVGYDRMLNRDAFICKTCKTSEDTLLAEKQKKAPPPAMPTMKRAPQVSQTVQRTVPPLVRLVAPRATSSSSILTSSTPPTPLTSASTSKTPPVRIPASFDPNNISGQLITLPPSLTSKLNLTKSVNLKWNGQSYVIPPNCFISTPDGLKVLLPAGTLANANKGTVSAQVTSGGVSLVNTAALAQSTLSRPSNVLGQISSVIPSSNSSSPQQPVAPKVIAPTSSNGGPHSPNIPAPVSSLSPEQASAPKLPPVKIKIVPQCHFLKVQAGYDAMVHLFSYLQPSDLLRASLVCRSWNHAAQSPSLWRRANLRGFQILNWKKFARFLRMHNTQVLDLRGINMGPKERRAEQWSEFTGCLRGLSDTVRDMRLPQCPGSVLTAITEALLDLEVVQAQAIIDPNTDDVRSSDSRVAVARFGELRSLRELKLRGVSGIQLPAFSIGAGLTELAKLTHLKTLSLTTLREATELEFTFLSSLKELETLELGECYFWTKQTYEQLGELSKLSSLRLESGGDTTDGLGPALEKLQQLRKLELIRFPVNEDLSESLQKLTSLEHFSIWPDMESHAARVNAATRQAVRNMGFLQTLEWGVAAADNTLLFPASPDPPANGEGEGGEGDGAAAEEREPKAVGINELVDELHVSLPTTSIRVFRVPAHQKRGSK